MHSTSSSRQLVQGAPFSTTLQRTFLALQHWHAFEARRLAGRLVGPGRPAVEALRLVPDGPFWLSAGERVAMIAVAGYHVFNIIIQRRQQ